MLQRARGEANGGSGKGKRAAAWRLALSRRAAEKSVRRYEIIEAVWWQKSMCIGTFLDSCK